MRKRVGVYVRVSTPDQSTRQQVDALTTWAKGRGHAVVEIFEDVASGADDKRPALKRLMRACTEGQVDAVAAVALDRLGRSLQHVVWLLRELNALGVDVFLLREGVDTSTPSGKALLGMAAIFAEFERDILVERIKAGMHRAEVHGTKSGKPIGRPALNDRKRAEIRTLAEQGMTKVEIASTVGVSRATVYRVLGEST